MDTSCAVRRRLRPHALLASQEGRTYAAYMRACASILPADARPKNIDAAQARRLLRPLREMHTAAMQARHETFGARPAPSGTPDTRG